ncbi:unnamed protein product [Owenia fusiformis]|uniref:Uncharacterized protein n=1 Tax=Owenia fusiformis TaxID=6347 RepID=A0A8J1T643_OWEFU|nr:unnamed protein product [Owenia fusiformis]
MSRFNWDISLTMSKVQLLDIGSNHLTSIGPGTFDYMTNLMHIDMSHNDIQTVDKLTWQKHLVIHIDFSHNNISNIDFLENVHVERLYLRSNPIGNIDFSRFPSIRYARILDISDTGLTTITRENLLPLIDIQHLSLADNDIFVLEPSIFDHMMKLKELDISNNKLTSLDKTMLPSLEKLDQCHFKGNPFHCNCELQWLKKSFDDSSSEGRNVSASCRTPFSTEMSTLSLSRMTCRKPVVTRFAGDNDIYGREPFTILCIAEGDPQPTILVRHPSGSTSQENPQAQNKSSYIYSNQIIYKIDRASQSDSGNYECLAKNIEGPSSRKSLTIDIQRGKRFERKGIAVAAAGTLAGAIVGTFIGTILLCILILFLLYKFVYPRLKKKYPPRRIVSSPRDPDKRTSTLSSNFHKPMLPVPLDEEPDTTYINETTGSQNIPPALPKDRTGVKRWSDASYSKIEVKETDPKEEQTEPNPIYEDLPDGAVYTSPKKIKGLHF